MEVIIVFVARKYDSCFYVFASAIFWICQWGILLQYYSCPGPFFKTIFTDRFIWIFSLQCCCLIDEHAKQHLLFIGFYQAYFLHRNADYVMTKPKFARSRFKTNKVDEILLLISSTSSIFVHKRLGRKFYEGISLKNKENFGKHL